MGIGPAPSGDQFAIMRRAQGTQRRRVIMLIAQHITHLGWQLGQKQRCHDIVSNVSGGELGRQRDPHAANGDRQVQLPAVPPPMPTRFAPGRFGIDARMRHYSLFPIFFMPYSPMGAQCGAVQGRAMALMHPGREHPYQVASKTANQSGQGLQASFPGATRRKAPLLGQQTTQLTGQRVVLVQKSQQCPCRVQSTNNHDHQRLQDQSIRIDLWPPSAWLERFGWHRNPVNQLHQADKNALSQYHFTASITIRIGSLKSYGGRRARASPECGFLIRSKPYDL
jgi:hypothetical protein